MLYINSREQRARQTRQCVTVHSVTSNTLRDAQKRQNSPFRAAALGIFVQNTHENTSRDGDV